MNKNEKNGFDREVDMEVGRLSTLVVANVLELLESKKMKRTDLADKIGVSRSHITQLLDGERNMTLETIAKLSVALDTHWVIDGMHHSASKASPAYTVVTVDDPNVVIIDPQGCTGTVVNVGVSLDIHGGAGVVTTTCVDTTDRPPDAPGKKPSYALAA